MAISIWTGYANTCVILKAGDKKNCIINSEGFHKIFLHHHFHETIKILTKNIYKNYLCSFTTHCRSSRRKVFCEKRVFRNFAKLTGTFLCQSVFFNKGAGLRCFPVNFVKFFTEPLWSLLLTMELLLSGKRFPNILKFGSHHGDKIHWSALLSGKKFCGNYQDFVVQHLLSGTGWLSNRKFTSIYVFY